jgi:hypothetical protein
MNAFSVMDVISTNVKLMNEITHHLATACDVECVILPMSNACVIEKREARQ